MMRAFAAWDVAVAAFFLPAAVSGAHEVKAAMNTGFIVQGCIFCDTCRASFETPKTTYIDAMAAVSALYVGDLHVEVTDANLFDLFITVGTLTSVRACWDSTTGRSLGYGYVNYSSSQDEPPTPATGGTRSHTSAPLRSFMAATAALISFTAAPDVCSGPMSSAAAAFPNSHGGPRLHGGLSL